MAQQINLYHPSLCVRPAGQALTRAVQWQSALLVLGLLCGGALQWHTSQLRADISSLGDQTQLRRAELQQLVQNGSDTPLYQQVKQLRQQEAGLTRLQTLLDTGTAGRREGYVGYLEALARQANPSVWITGLTLQADNDAIELQGGMSDPASLPEYLRTLQAEPHFKGRQFATLSIRRVDLNTASDTPDKAKPVYSEFTLRSHPPKTTAADGATSGLAGLNLDALKKP